VKKAVGKRQLAKGRRQKAEGKREEGRKLSRKRGAKSKDDKNRIMNID